MILHGDVLDMLKTLDSESVHCCVTSPPYWGLRDYGVEGQLGLEKTPQEYIAKMVEVFREVRRVLRDDGTLWLNLGDSYAGSGKGAYADGEVRLTDKSKIQITSAGTHTGKFNKTEAPDLKPKDLVGIPWRVAFALQADGWYLRSDIIWHKPNPMPESVTDRPTKAHEYLFLLAKSQRYYFDQDSVREPHLHPDVAHISQIKTDGQVAAYLGHAPTNLGRCGNNPDGRNIRSVWTIPTQPTPEAHFATFPEALIVPCIKAGCPEGGTVLDPFFGSGTTGIVAKKLQRKWIGIELNAEYIKIAEKRIEKECGLLI
jgi:DNA modification methylase